jgi:hypothetical protein
MGPPDGATKLISREHDEEFTFSRHPEAEQMHMAIFAPFGRLTAVWHAADKCGSTLFTMSAFLAFPPMVADHGQGLA